MLLLSFGLFAFLGGNFLTLFLRQNVGVEGGNEGISRSVSVFSKLGIIPSILHVSNIVYCSSVFVFPSPVSAILSLPVPPYNLV